MRRPLLPKTASGRPLAAEGRTARRASISIVAGMCRVSLCWGPTFDMSGGRKQAKPAGGRPLDGRVGPRRGWMQDSERAADSSCDKAARTLPSTGRLIHAQGPSADGFRLAVAHCSKCFHISSQPFRLAARWPPQDGQSVRKRRLPRISMRRPLPPKTASGRPLAAEGRTARRASISIVAGMCRVSLCWGPTFDMSGGRKQAKPAGGRPLDGRVGPRRDWKRTWEHAVDGSHDGTGRTTHTAGRRTHARRLSADDFRLAVAHRSKCFHISS